jgi:ribosome biogenesis protein SSF1/2
MNNFKTIPDDAKEPALQSQRRTENFVADAFRSMFPPVSPETAKLGASKRILLLNREPTKGEGDSFDITLRHYSVSTKRVGLPKAIRRLNAAEKSRRTERRGKGVPNLGKLDDVADYMLNEDAGNYTSASDSEPDTDGEVEVLTQPKQSRFRSDKSGADGSSKRGYDADDQVERRGVVLSEIGPRISLKLIKIEEGLCEGKVIWHEFITKTKQEEKQMEVVWEKRNQEKEERRRIQKENVERKKKERRANKPKGDAAVEGEEEDEDEDMEDYKDWEGDFEDDEMEVA